MGVPEIREIGEGFQEGKLFSLLHAKINVIDSRIGSSKGEIAYRNGLLFFLYSPPPESQSSEIGEKNSKRILLYKLHSCIVWDVKQK